MDGAPGENYRESRQERKMKSVPETTIAQEKRATLSAASFCPDPRKAVVAAKCLNCGQNFTKKRKKHFFCSAKCRFHFWDHQRMDFRALARKVDLVLESTQRLERAVGIKEGGER